MRRTLAALWLIALVSDVAAQEFELPTLRGSTPYVAAPPVYHSWSGFYAGGVAGTASITTMDFGNAPRALIANILRFTKLEDEFHPSEWTSIPSAHPRGVTLGGFVGYNSQWDDVVLGVEGSYHFMQSPLFGSGTDALRRLLMLSDNYNYDVTVASSASMKLYDYATGRVRAGYVMGQFLPYMTAGLALGRIDYAKSATVSYPDPVYALTPPPPPPPPATAPKAFTQTQSGESEGADVDARVRDRGGVVIGATNAGADERRQAPPGTEVDIEIGQRDDRAVVAVIDVEEAAAGAIIVAADRLELDVGAIFAGQIETQPAVPLIADAGADEDRVLDVLLVDAPRRGPRAAGGDVGLREIERLEALCADADVAAQIPATGLDDRLVIVGRLDRQISRERRGADQRSSSCERKHPYMTRDFVLSSNRGDCPTGMTQRSEDATKRLNGT
jgi:outer membrane immunogenic protein